MRQRLLLTGIICVLLLHGWGTVLAAALCPHASSRLTASSNAAHVDITSVAAKTEDLPACCRQEKKDEGAHCSMRQQLSAQAAQHSGASHESSELQISEKEKLAATTPQTTNIHHIPCAHCMARPGQPPVFIAARELKATKRDGGERAPRELKPPIPYTLLFVCAIIPSQGAPPGARAANVRRHILNNVFLI